MAFRRTKSDTLHQPTPVAANGDASVATAAVPKQPAPPRNENWTRLGDLVTRRTGVTSKQVAEALLQQSASGKPLGRLLVELGALNDRELAAVLAEQMDLEFIDLSQEEPDAEVIPLLPESLAHSETAIPITEIDGTLIIAVAEPSDELHAQLSAACPMPVMLAVAPAGDIRRAIDASYRALTGVDENVEAFLKAEATRPKGPKETTPIAQTAAAAGGDAPVVQLVNKLLVQALRDRASDIHIEPQDDRVRIRFRIDGALHDIVALPTDIGPALASRIKIMGSMNLVERRRPQDGQITLELDGRHVDVRVSSVGVHWGEKIVLRILDKSRSLYHLGELGMPKDTHETFSKLIRSPFGMVICAGPTGSGKTTTLYASLSELNDSQRNIMTVEDPVEYVFPSINQIQTNEQAGLTFASGLKSILRQDPDIILVGESRDVDTARIAVQSALTGHFVLTSLHATDAVAALHRFLDMGIESFLIASSVVAVVGQRLVRRTCQSCRAPYRPTEEELAFYAEAGGRPKRTWYQGEGCHMCSNTGYQDRIGVYELLRITPEIKRLVVGWATQDELRRTAQSQGMRTLQDEALNLIQNDVTTISEIVRSIYAY
ncbi:MAG: GspE/PulE family protein [Mycobacteriales bacterium]